MELFKYELCCKKQALRNSQFMNRNSKTFSEFIINKLRQELKITEDDIFEYFDQGLLDPTLTND